MSRAPLRIGCLGAARIAPGALVVPARIVPHVQAFAVAARDPRRAAHFARKHGIPHVRESYEALVEDPRVDAVYNPLPNSLHAEWTIRALEAGKHVLCEKPLASNAREAVRMADAAERSGKVLMEAFHYRYHPLMDRVLTLLGEGVIGDVRRIETAMCVPLPRLNDIRYRRELSGGAMMDVGCYAVHMLRTVAGAEPTVVRARAKRLRAGVDRAVTAEVAFPDGRTGQIECSLLSRKLFKLGIRVLGTEGELRVFPNAIQHHRLSVRTARSTRTERVPGESTYTHQLRAFAAAVQEGAPTLTPPADSVANMRVIDAIYERAGMQPRGL